MTVETLAGDLFDVYRRNLAAMLDCDEGELPAVTRNLSEDDFDALANAQNSAEESAWAEARGWADWPRPWSEEEDAIAEEFQRLRMEAGY